MPSFGYMMEGIIVADHRRCAGEFLGLKNGDFTNSSIAPHGAIRSFLGTPALSMVGRDILFHWEQFKHT
jgi:hypothetical protein